MIDKENFYCYNMYELLQIKDKFLRQEILALYNAEIEEIRKDEIGKMFADSKKSLIDIYNEIDEYSNKSRYISEYLFPRDHVNMYPITSLHIASKEYMSIFSGNIIGVGEQYTRFTAFFYNFSNKKNYILEHPFRLENYYTRFLPQTFLEYEDFVYKVDHSYERSSTYDELDYYSISSHIESLNLKELKKDPVRERLRRKLTKG